MGYLRRTARGHDLFEVASALQKSIRRGDVRSAGYWAIELFEGGYAGYCWKRLLTVSAEDVAGIITKEIVALHDGFLRVNETRGSGGKWRGRIFIAKAVILLAHARKSRDADHLTNLWYDPDKMDAAEIEQQIDEARAELLEIPDYALDVHTRKGKAAGKTKRDFFIEEFDALDPREQGVFDKEVEQLRMELS